MLDSGFVQFDALGVVLGAMSAAPRGRRTASSS
jgi:hypothetical protein